jgi:hypothetical protein
MISAITKMTISSGMPSEPNITLLLSRNTAGTARLPIMEPGAPRVKEFPTDSYPEVVAR